MIDARKQILAKLGAGDESNEPLPEAVLPAFEPSSDALTTRLRQKLEAVHTSVDVVSTDVQLSESIFKFLERCGSEMRVGVSASIDKDTLLANKQVAFYTCEDLANCQTIITSAPYAIAETGSLILPSGVTRPTLANFLPDNCIVLLDEANIVSYLEAGFEKVRNSDAGMPRALNLISGPSKTADIEQTLIYGAHGPIQLHVIIRRI